MPKLVFFLCSLFGLSQPVFAAKPSVDSLAQVVGIAVELTLDNTASEIDKHNVLAFVANSAAGQEAFLSALSSNLTPQNKIRLQQAIVDLRAHPKASPVSHGFAGGFRTPIALGLLISLHWAAHGHEGSFAPTTIEKQEWAQQVAGMQGVALVLLGVAAIGDSIAYFREAPSQRSAKIAQKNATNLLLSIEKLIKEGGLHTEPAVERQVLGAVRSLFKEVNEKSTLWRRTENERREQWNLQTEMERRASVQRGEAPEAGVPLLAEARQNEEEEVTRLIAKWLSSDEGNTVEDLLKTSFRVEDDRKASRFQVNGIKPEFLWTMFWVGLGINLYGAYTNTTADTHLTDFILWNTSFNVTDAFRRLWMPYGMTITAGLASATALMAVARSPKYRSRDREAEKINLLTPSNWLLVRHSILNAALMERTPDNGNRVSQETARELVEKIADRVHQHSPPRRVNLRPVGVVESCSHYLRTLSGAVQEQIAKRTKRN